jgi:hypothetical protein
LNEIESGKIHEKVAKDIQPTMPFRQVAYHRVLFDVDQESLVKEANYPGLTQINPQEISSEDFKRSGTRTWNLPPKEYTTSTVVKATGMLFYYLQPPSHHPQSNVNHNSDVTINDRICLRINKYAKNEDTSEPTPEGVHQDGTEISSVAMIQRRNILRGGESRLWTLDQPKGNYISAESGKLDAPVKKGFSWKNCLFDKVLESPRETLIFNDRVVKHEVRAFIPADEAKDAQRDVLINFVRKPLLYGSDKMRVSKTDHVVAII